MGQQRRTYTDDYNAAAVDRLYEPGGVRPMRTSLRMILNAGTYAEQSWRHSARAAARLSLKLFLL
jgi:hypothetical protein